MFLNFSIEYYLEIYYLEFFFNIFGKELQIRLGKNIEIIKKFRIKIRFNFIFICSFDNKNFKLRIIFILAIAKRN